MTDWVEIVVPVGGDSAGRLVEEVGALVASEIRTAGAGTQQRTGEVVFWVEASALPNALAEARAAVQRWAAAGMPLDPASVHSTTAVPESEWRDAWKRHFKTTRLSRQFVVVPSWDSFAPAADDIVIELDPGLAFGTGAHASTSLILEEIQQLADEGMQPPRMLDVGCGSGILAIAAAKRWPAATCVAIDIDPTAVSVTRENAERNGVAHRIETTTQALSATGERFPLTVANILADPLRELAPALIARTAGTLVLSGLLTEQAAPLASEFVAAGMTLIRIRASSHDPQWSSVTLRVA